MTASRLPDYTLNWGALTFLLLFVFVPTVLGGFYATLAAIMLFAIVYLALKTIKMMRFSGTFVMPVVLLSLLSLTIFSSALSMLTAEEPFTLIRLSEIIKPVLFMIILVFAANVNLNYAEPEIKKTIVLAAKIIILGELVVVFDQAFNIDLLSKFYGSDKESSTEEIFTFLRSTGTLGNPNYFAWTVLQCAVAIQAFSKKSSRHLWSILVLFLVLLSGSKSMFVAYPIAMLTVTWLKSDRVLFSKHNLYWLLFAVSLAIATYHFVNYFPDVFPRLKVLIALLTGEDLTGGGRYQIWENAYAYFLKNQQGVSSWLLGLGPIEMFTTLDNGYLYVFFRYGIVGLLLHLSILIYFVVQFYNLRDRELGGFVVQYIVVGMLLQTQAEALAGWQYPVLLYFYAGLAISYLYNLRTAANREKYQSDVERLAQGSRTTLADASTAY